MTEPVAAHTLQEAVNLGVREFCICPGARNAPLIALLKLETNLKTYYFYDERSAAFFALGRCQASGKPVAVITTSGTAVSYLLGAAMEAYYTGIPLLLITADRPRRFRNSNAPQSCEQVGLYGKYINTQHDIALDEPCDLSTWDRCSPAHINICLEEPSPKDFPEHSPIEINEDAFALADPPMNYDDFHLFLKKTHYPFVVVGSLKAQVREAVAQFLLNLNAPVYLEAISGLRQDPKLRHLSITRSSKLWEHAEVAGYKIDGVLRIGGVPTFRLWRDLEERQGEIRVFSVNDVPFSGLSWGPIHCTPLDQFFQEYTPAKQFRLEISSAWREADRTYNQQLHRLFQEEPKAEPSLVHALSKKIQPHALVYLGNSLPIREWDMAATWDERHHKMYATRGLNGIDGQTSVFLGLSSPLTDNWALLGDLTALHDLAGPWILPQLHSDTQVNIAVINNGGGKIFEKMFPQKEIQNCHSVGFQPVAQLWNLHYDCWRSIPDDISCKHHRLIEIVPDASSSKRFWDKLAKI